LAGQEPVKDLARGGDLDFDVDVRVVAAGAAERVEMPGNRVVLLSL
jgi:hypothetical protein